MTFRTHGKSILGLVTVAVMGLGFFCGAAAPPKAAKGPAEPTAGAVTRKPAEEIDPFKQLGPTEEALLLLIPTLMSTSLHSIDPQYGGKAVINTRSALGLNFEGRSGGFDYFEFRGLLKLTSLSFWSPATSGLEREQIDFWAIHLAPVFRPFKNRYLTFAVGAGLVKEPLLRPVSSSLLAVVPVLLPLAEFIASWRVLEGPGASLGIEAGIETIFGANAGFVKYRNGFGTMVKIVARAKTSFGEIFVAPVYRLRISTTETMTTHRQEVAVELGFGFTL